MRRVSKADGEPMTTVSQLLYVDHLVRVTCAVTPGSALIRIIGELDKTNSAEVLRMLERSRRIDHPLVLDVGQVGFADVTAVRALVAFAERTGAPIRDTPYQMRRLMRLMRLRPFGEPENPSS
ncbi:STAS domain-containing protein [Nonomuraea turcica]|uniref:STAS domain-containing protein n=1 Tax=Nonomuraea sp. G32 TaxID=3067274 RepID=UPI00273C5706|nr:STAS domain-containing protein [Nonomuraea sp. G32]MDP4502180.1 STAS domain-containing protein [Nonomuraea sp. G32]